MLFVVCDFAGRETLSLCLDPGLPGDGGDNSVKAESQEDSNHVLVQLSPSTGDTGNVTGNVH